MKDGEAHPDGRGDHARSLPAKGPEEQAKDEDLTPGSFQEQIPGLTCDGASHRQNPEVRNAALLSVLGPPAAWIWARLLERV